MGRGVGMPFALLNGQKVKAATFQKEDKDGLHFLCAGFGCGVPVDHVRGYYTHGESAKNRKIVAPLFRLHQGHEHTDSCDFTIKNQVKKVVADSQAVDDKQGPFLADKNGNYIFRLNIPDEVLSKLADEEFETDDKRVNGKIFVRSNRKLLDYLRSAASIAKVRSSLIQAGDKDELSRQVKIMWLGEYIDWRDFFYDFEDYEYLLRKLRQQTLQHPVAIHVFIKETASQGTSSAAICGFPKTHAEINELKVSLYGQSQLINKIESGFSYIVFGHPILKLNTLQRDSADATTANLTLHCREQFHQLHTPEDTEFFETDIDRIMAAFTSMREQLKKRRP